MKAMILAAGLGKRLGSLTEYTPKPLLPVDGKPVFDRLLESLVYSGFTDIIANTYYLARQFEKHMNSYSPELYRALTLFREDELSGSAGALLKCEDFFKDEQDFLVVSGDIVTSLDFKSFMHKHKRAGNLMTMAVYKVPKSQVSKYGVVVCDDNDNIIDFQEKPDVEDAKSTLINAGIYAFNRKIFEYIDYDKPQDFAKDVFQRLLLWRLSVQVYLIESYWNDIGSIEQYAKAQLDLHRF